MATASYSTLEVSRLVKLPEHRVREFARAGVVAVGDFPDRSPGGPYRFNFSDVLVLRLVERLLQSGLSPGRVIRALRHLREEVHASKPLSSLHVFARGGRVVAVEDGKTWEPENGQRCLCFDPVEPESQSTKDPVALLPSQQPSPASAAPSAAVVELAHGILHQEDPADSAEAWFGRALQLEETHPEQAYHGYLNVLARNPEHVEATINVGRLCSAAGDLQRAAAYFRQSVRLGPTHPVAHYNLAVTLHDLGDLDSALGSYKAALIHDPGFADAHYNLAALLEQRGDRKGALRHLQTYRAMCQDDGGN